MRIINKDNLERLSRIASRNQRLRQHFNLHDNYSENCQKLLNAIQPDSYIQPHRHYSDPKTELLVLIKGEFAVVFFSNSGEINHIGFLEVNGSRKNSCNIIEIESTEWHTVVALKPNSILLEIKAGPFDPHHAKDFAIWAPKENTIEMKDYFENLKFKVRQEYNKI
jgi:cupin fold WbuC family metalloprotein